MPIYRTATRADFPAIIAIWREAFHDGAEGAAFLERYYSPASTLVAEEDSAVVAMAHLVFGGTYLKRPCPYLYAVAVRSDRRGSGLGKGITLFAAQTAAALGFGYVATCPEQPSLMEFYRRLGFTAAATLSREFKPSRDMLKHVSFMENMLVKP